MFLMTVNSTKWAIHNTFILSDLELDNATLRHHLYCALMVFCAFVIFLLFCLLLFVSRDTRSIWIYSSALSLVFLGTIASIWYFALEYSSHKQNTENIIYNDSRARQVAHKIKFRQSRIDRNQSMYTIPTGVYLRSIKLTDMATVLVNGTVWQKYSSKLLPDDMVKEITFPNAVVKALEPIDERQFENYVLKKWQFEVEIVKLFDLSRYPLEFEQVALQIKQRDHKYKVLLTPDIASYRVTAPTSRPCISKSLAIPGWNIVESYFSVGMEDEKPTFGEKHSYLTAFHPVLQFNFTLHRKFIDVFVSHLTPIFLVLFLLFVGLMVSNVGSKYAGKFKSDDLTKLISFCSGLLFIVVFTHIGIREKVDAEKLFLLEYFYLVSYFAFFYIIVNIILYKVDMNSPVIGWRNNLLYKVIFWPIIWGTILVVSLLTFY